MESQFSIQSGKSLPTQTLPFRAYGLMIDNFTNQWYYEPSSRRFVGPYVSGALVPLAGVVNADLQNTTPAKITQPPVNQSEYVIATYLDQTVPTSAGVAVGELAGGPISQPVAVFTQNAGPHGGAQRIQYGPPAGRQAIIDSLELMVHRTAAATTVGLVECYAQLTPAGGTAKTIFYLALLTNVVGDKDRIVASNLGPIFNGDVLTAFDNDASVGGTVTYLQAVKVREMQAIPGVS